MCPLIYIMFTATQTDPPPPPPHLVVSLQVKWCQVIHRQQSGRKPGIHLLDSRVCNACLPACLFAKGQDLSLPTSLPASPFHFYSVLSIAVSICKRLYCLSLSKITARRQTKVWESTLRDGHYLFFGGGRKWHYLGAWYCLFGAWHYWLGI